MGLLVFVVITKTSHCRRLSISVLHLTLISGEISVVFCNCRSSHDCCFLLWTIRLICLKRLHCVTIYAVIARPMFPAAPTIPSVHGLFKTDIDSSSCSNRVMPDAAVTVLPVMILVPDGSTRANPLFVKMDV